METAPEHGERSLRVISIEPVPKHYAWGSHTRLQDLFGMETGTPLAEMWFSGHASSPSLLRIWDGRAIALDEAIRTDPDFMVGPMSSHVFGPVLPYLFKLISACIPLSLQVHPVGFEARAGYHREQVAGVPADAPERSFRDMLAKHEMVVALEPFQAAVGFMLPDLAAQALAAVGEHPLALRMMRALAGEPDPLADAMMPEAAIAWPPAHRRMFRAFHAAVTAQNSAGRGLSALLEAARLRAASVGGVPSRIGMAIDNACKAARAFSDDPSALALLMMNPVRLDPGEAVFIPAGVPHEYIRGTGAEIMTNSDNVLRAGMTVKRRDIPNLLRSLDCQPSAPIDPQTCLQPPTSAPSATVPSATLYRPPVDEFMLAYGHVGDWRVGDAGLAANEVVSGDAGLPQGPRVLLCCEGRVRCADGMGERALERGEAVFVPAGAGRLDIGSDAGATGAYLLASTPF